MDRNQFIIATAVVLFAAFVLGWFASWLIHRLTRPTRSDLSGMERLTRQLHAAEQAKGEALALLSAAEAARDAAQAELRETRIEVEELRDYIEQKFGPPPEEG
ncbi:hypothetical protein KTN05_08560 [Paracoccus sp. Z118]|uniref:hypothetical protein n=1 Tax=Paracoccus sp. Z118 TaxID=2851017 RepID=UPI001C2BAE36|nr:hypothetical protein [Paracoccus sp. Z118]MBV0891900.1 hypothetical protein [Paracoccus sp. Z118]